MYIDEAVSKALQFDYALKRKSALKVVNDIILELREGIPVLVTRLNKEGKRLENYAPSLDDLVADDWCLASKEGEIIEDI